MGRGFLLAFAVGASLIEAAAAQTVSVLEDLDFGRLLTTDGAPGFVLVPPQGLTSSSANVIRLTQARPAEFLVEGLLPGQEVNIAAFAPSAIRFDPPEFVSLEVSDVSVAPSPVIADGLGRARFTVGARLTVTGATAPGANRTFTERLNVTVTPAP